MKEMPPAEAVAPGISEEVGVCAGAALAQAAEIMEIRIRMENLHGRNLAIILHTSWAAGAL
jgi:hypothetical protein